MHPSKLLGGVDTTQEVLNRERMLLFSVATEVVLRIRCMAMACMLVFFRRESLEMLPEPSYQ